MTKLSTNEITTLVEAALTARLDRDNLLIGLPDRIRQRLPLKDNRYDQLLSDVSVLVGTEVDETEAAPIETWLRNAAHGSHKLKQEGVFRAPLQAMDERERGKNPAASNTTKLVLLSASPTDQERLSVDIELREVKSSIKEASKGPAFVVVEIGALRAKDLLGALLDERPDILHFAGHGDEATLYAVNDANRTHPIPKVALADLFAGLRDHLRLVVLNSCSSAEESQAIADQVGCVVCMREPVEDTTAQVFARAFYRALASGCTVEQACELGANAPHLEGHEKAPVQIVSGKGANPAELRFRIRQ
jgi:hypothetical protein